MNNHEPFNRLFTLSACALATALCFVSTVAFAQTTQAGPGQGGATPQHQQSMPRNPGKNLPRTRQRRLRQLQKRKRPSILLFKLAIRR